MTEPRDKELGILVAKEVMGWTEWVDLYQDYDGPYPMFADWDDGKYFLLYEDADTGDFTRTWAPWRSLDDAWEVVEKLPYFQLYRWASGHWQCQSAFCGDHFDHLLVRDGVYVCACRYADGSNPCEAILRAALKAVRGEGDG